MFIFYKNAVAILKTLITCKSIHMWIPPVPVVFRGGHNVVYPENVVKKFWQKKALKKKTQKGVGGSDEYITYATLSVCSFNYEKMSKVIFKNYKQVWVHRPFLEPFMLIYKFETKYLCMQSDVGKVGIYKTWI